MILKKHLTKSNNLMEYLSTSALANEFEIPYGELFLNLKTLGWVDRVNDKWVLTELGIEKGGKIYSHPKYGEYIAWPYDLMFDPENQRKFKRLLNATIISSHFNVSASRLHLILSELGWIEKDITGWVLTSIGKAVGGRQFENDFSGKSYVLWPYSIINNPSLIDVFNNEDIEEDEPITKSKTAVKKLSIKKKTESFREKFEAKHRTKDGHYVRSRAEVIIDNTLYDYGLVHAYEKKVPVEEELDTDFYLPNGKVYIEYWGMENDLKYLERKKKKQELYQKYELKLIELNDEDILNLDDHLPKKLLRFGIRVY